MKPKFLFGDIVVVEDVLIGVIVKTWQYLDGEISDYDVYVREFNSIVNYPENKIERYAVRHKELNEEELRYQKSYVSGF